jgi:hypothetical protein
MDREDFIKEVKLLGEGCTIETNDGKYTIEDGGSFLGGIEGTFMSELLGNVYYDDIEDIAYAMYNYIVNKLHEEIIDVNF